MVILGFQERPYEHYHPDDLASPTAQTSSTLALMALATRFGYKLYQTDFSGAFLQGSLETPLWIKVPFGAHEALGIPKDIYACQIVSGLYGLKQASKIFFDLLVKTLTDIGFVQHKNVDPCLFTLKNERGSIWITTHVDDLTVVTTDEEYWIELCEKIKKILHISINIPAEYILSMKTEEES